MKVGADQKAQADLAQVAAFLFVMAAGGQGRWVGGVDVAEEVSAIIDQGAQVDLQVLNEAFGELSLDGENVLFFDSVHVVPKGLTGKLSGGGGQQAGQDALVVPTGQLGLAGRGGRPVECGKDEILADGQALVAFGELGVDQFRQAELVSLVIESGHVAEVEDFRLLRGLGNLGALDGLEDAVERTEVSGFDDFGFAVDALAVADIVIGAAFDEFARERRHMVRSYNRL